MAFKDVAKVRNKIDIPNICSCFWSKKGRNLRRSCYRHRPKKVLPHPVSNSPADIQDDNLFTTCSIVECPLFSEVLSSERARRKPRLLLRLPGVLLLRFATRQFLALLFQLPPRFTRFDPLFDYHLFPLFPYTLSGRTCCRRAAQRKPVGQHAPHIPPRSILLWYACSHIAAVCS